MSSNAMKPDTRGFSLVELMVALAVVGIFMGAVYQFFITVFSQSTEQAAQTRRTVQQQLGLTLVKRDLSKVGFGIDSDQSTGNIIAGNASQITFRSTSVSGRAAASGQFGLVVGGTVSGIASDTVGVVETSDRELMAGPATLSTLQTNGELRDRRVFFAGNQNTAQPYYYERRYALSSGTSEYCADGVNNLQWEDYPAASYGASEPVIDCVRDFRLRYGFQQSAGGLDYSSDPATAAGTPEDAVPDTLKVGIIFQVGQETRKTVSTGPLSYSDADLANGGDVPLNGNQDHFRWQVAEWEIPLDSMPED